MSTASPKLSLSAKSLRTHEQPISYLINAALANPNLINFAAGLVDSPSLPVKSCDTITRRLFSDPVRARSALQYGTTLGLAPLRQALLSHIESLENRPASSMSLTPDHILITNGSQQALYLIGDTLLNPGDIVIAANPSYFVYTGTLSSLGATVLTVPMDSDGMNVQAISKLLQKLKSQRLLHRVKLIYCTSYFQNPTGLSLSLARRKRLLQIVRQFSQSHRILILEDAAYRELCYEGPSLPSIKSFDPKNEYTILTQTFSKPFAPGLKIGYTVMPRDLLDPILQQKGNHDFGSPNLCQHILCDALTTGLYHRHVLRLRNSYRKKRDTLLRALDRFLPPSTKISWTHPNGGLYVWLTLPKSLNTSRNSPLFQAALDAGVLYVPGDYCSQPDSTGSVPSHHIRLCFGQVPLNQITPGIRKLAAVLSCQLPTPSKISKLDL